MSQLTVGQLVSFVQDYIPGVPKAKVIRKFNLLAEEIFEEVSQVEWSTVTTRAKVTTGTVSVTNGSTSVTFSSGVLAAPSTDSLVFGQIGDDPTWYPVTYVSSTSGTLASKYAGTTNALATFTLVYPVIVFPAAVGQVLGMRYRGEKLEFATPDNASARYDAETIGRPRWYGQYVHDPNATPDDAHRVILWPFADATYSLEFCYLRRPTLLGVTDGDSAILGLPSTFNRAIEFGTLALCWSQEDGGARFGEWWGRYERALSKARATANVEVTGPRNGSLRRRGRNTSYYERQPGT